MHTRDGKWKWRKKEARDFNYLTLILLCCLPGASAWTVPQNIWLMPIECTKDFHTTVVQFVNQDSHAADRNLL